MEVPGVQSMEEEKGQACPQLGQHDVWMQSRNGLQRSQSHSKLSLRENQRGILPWALGDASDHSPREVHTDLWSVVTLLVGQWPERKEIKR